MIKTAAEFIRLRQSDVLEEYTRAANEEAELSVWLEIIERHPEMHQWVAHNKTVPVSILEVLSRSADETVRYAVAMKRKLSHTIYARLANDSDDSVRAAVARNPKVPAELLELLARDDSPLVSSVAQARADL